MNAIASYLILAAILFCIGLYGALTKRNAIIVLLSVELMLNSVNLNSCRLLQVGNSAELDRSSVLALYDYDCGCGSCNRGRQYLSRTIELEERPMYAR